MRHTATEPKRELRETHALGALTLKQELEIAVDSASAIAHLGSTPAPSVGVIRSPAAWQSKRSPVA